MMPNVHAGRLERRVRLVGNETMPTIHGFCPFYPFGAIRGVPQSRTGYSIPSETLCGVPNAEASHKTLATGLQTPSRFGGPCSLLFALGL